MSPPPSKSDLRDEAEEEEPTILLTVSDGAGKEVRTLTGPVTAGSHRVSWDLRLASTAGPQVPSGTYRVKLARRVDGVTTPLGDVGTFKVTGDEPPAERKEQFDFLTDVQRLERATTGAGNAADETAKKLEQIRAAIDQTPGLAEKWKEVARTLEKRTREIQRTLRGDVILQGRNENTPESVQERVQAIQGGLRQYLGRPTKTQEENYRFASEELDAALSKLRQLVEVDLKALEKALDEAGAPWTPGRLPAWKRPEK